MKKAKAEPSQKFHAFEDRFIEHWNELGDLLGINAAMARIHGLLYINGAALSMEGIMARLAISRGNVSMNLKKLTEWGLVRRIHKKGQRREYFESLKDAGKMFAIVAERKRREIDPIIGRLRDCNDLIHQTAANADPYRRRLGEVLKLLESFGGRAG